MVKDFIIPPSKFEVRKLFITTEIPNRELYDIELKHFLKKFHKFTNNGFRIVITWKTRNIHNKIYNMRNFLENTKTIINGVLLIKNLVLVVCVTLVKPSVMQKLDRTNKLIQLKVQNYRNTFEATSTTVSYGLP